MEPAALGEGVGELEDLDEAVVGLADDEQVEQPDDAAVDEVHERRAGLAGQPVTGELEQDVVDRPVHLVAGGDLTH